jgi:hypothetical protein
MCLLFTLRKPIQYIFQSTLVFKRKYWNLECRLIFLFFGQEVNFSNSVLVEFLMVSFNYFIPNSFQKENQLNLSGLI